MAIKEIWYVEYLNKDKNFKRDRKDFETYKEAREWSINNFEKFHDDMIGIETIEIEDIKPKPKRKYTRRKKIDSKELTKGIELEKKEHNLTIKQSEKMAKDHLKENENYYTDLENCEISKENNKTRSKRTPTKQLLNSNDEFNVYLGVIYELSKKVRNTFDLKNEKFKITRQMNIIKNGYNQDSQENKIKIAKMIAPVVRQIMDKNYQADKKMIEIFSNIYANYKSFGNKKKVSKNKEQANKIIEKFNNL